jgi:hypothetical protein
MDIDFVITYVDCSDPVWQETYAKNVKRKSFNASRYRSWDNLVYLFRGVAKFMPWIRNLFLVVQSESQVPAWVNRSTVKVITHDMIIPKRFLPTFNSCTIEMFLWKIPGLSENWIYSNDDTFPIGDLKESDFFASNGYPKIHFKGPMRFNDFNLFRSQCRSGMDISGVFPDERNIIIKPDHIFLAHRKSTGERLYAANNSRIHDTITKTRHRKNCNQYIYSYSEYRYKTYIDHRINYIYSCFSQTPLKKMLSAITSGKYQAICVNDDMMDIDFEYYKKSINSAFSAILGEKSKYEI